MENTNMPCLYTIVWEVVDLNVALNTVVNL